jgi:hypothetical protein
MNVDSTLFRIHVFDDSTDPRDMPPIEKWLVWSRGGPFPFYEGFYCAPSEIGDSSNSSAPLATFHVHRDLVVDLELIISVFSRELAQYLMQTQPEAPNDQTEYQHIMELMPLFFGLGIFAANAVLRERSGISLGWEYWSMTPHGSLPSRYMGYALALLTWLKQEPLPRWKSHLRRDAEMTLQASLKYLEKSGDTILSREPSAKPYESRPLEVWLEDLRHGTPGRRVAALWAIQSHSHLISGGEQVSLIAGNLSHHDPFVRSAAAQALDTLGESASQSIPALLTTLEDRNGSVRMTAAFALGKMTGHAEDIIPNLSSLLNDRNVHVANAAAWSLGQFGLQAEEAGPVIVRLLRRGILHCEESTLDDILDALLAVSNQPEEVIMETLLERDAETCRRALDLLKERQIDVKDRQLKAESAQPD